MSEIERQLLWYKTSQDCPERHFWNFLIINEKREIDIIRQKLYDNLGYIIEQNIIDKGKIQNSDLSYELFCLQVTKPTIDFSGVYKGKITKDRRLQQRKSRNGWNDLIDKITHGEI